MRLNLDYKHMMSIYRCFHEHVRLTIDHVLQVLAARGPRLILEMPGACFLPEHEPYVSAIFRHILEDPVTLQAAMEAEIRNTLSARGQHADAAGLL